MKVKLIREINTTKDIRKTNLETLFEFARTNRNRSVVYIYGLRKEAGGVYNEGDVISLGEPLENDIIIEGTRDFCKKQVANRASGKFYTEKQIRSFAKTDTQAKYGLNAFDNGGGFWNKTSKSGKSYETLSHCRHTWFAVEVLGND